MRIKRAATAASCLLLATAAATSAADSPYEIRLLERTWTPQAGLSATAGQALEQRSASLRAQGRETIHVLVQLWAIPSESERNDLWRDGLDLGPYATGNAWIAALPAERVAEIARRPEVRFIIPWDAPSKVHPSLKAGDVAPWALDPERPGWVMTFVQLHHDVALERGWELAEAAGGVAMEPIEGLHGLTVWLPAGDIAKLAIEEDVLWIQEGPPPLSPTNDGVRAQMRVDPVNGPPYSLDGTGVRVFVFDGGRILSTHETFNAGAGSRVTLIDSTATSSHATHVAGTVGGDGAPSSSGGRGRGVATDVTFLSAGYQQSGGTMLFWDNAGDIQADYALARNTHNADLGTNSIGSNTASNGYPCEREGDYDVSGSLLDGIVRGDNGAVNGAVLLTWANGNERTGGNPRGRCGSNYLTTAPPSCAKNPIHIGALNSDGGSMTSFSSWGPCDDGRMKPVVSAPGCESGRVAGETAVYSSLSTSTTTYGLFCGTSMATPAVAGVVSLFIEDWRSRGFGGPNDRPLPALVKAMLVHSARDQGQDGPDFIYGYGQVDTKGLIDLERAGSGSLGAGGSTVWGTDAVANGQTDSFSFTVPSGTGELKATLAWDDAAAAAFVASAPVNNLNLELVSPSSTIHRPWVLSAANPHLPATTGVNGLDNQEQAVVINPAAGTWTVRVVGTSVPTGPQSYGLAYTATPATFDPGTCSTQGWGFEAGNDGWTLTGASRVAAPAAGHGSFSLRFGNANGAAHEATLDVAVPAGSTRAEWTFFWYMTTTESPSTGGFGFDFFYAEVRSTGGSPLAVFDFRTDGWRQAAWMDQQNIDLTPWAGQTVRLAFRGTNDGSFPTSFWVDDVALQTCGTGGGGNTPPAVTITAPADGSSFTAGTSIAFSGTAIDAEDGDISSGLAWTSSLDGAIGSGASFATSSLSAGTHTITASVTDSGGLPGSDDITVTVTSGSVTVTFTSIGAEDGRVQESSENSNQGGTVNTNGTGSNAIRVGDNQQDRQQKGFLSFDTSSIPDGATVTSAILRIRRGSLSGTNPFTTHGSCLADVANPFFGTGAGLVASDFQAAATAVGVAAMSNPTSNGALSQGSLNAAGLAAVNKTGRTQFRVYFTLDDNDDNGNDYVGFYSGDNGTASNRPTLEVTYTP